MKKFLPITIVLALCCLITVSCEKGGTAPEGKEITTAVQFKDGADKYFMYQHKCPVCDGEPIEEDYYADTERGRVYFDKEECRDKFKANSEKFLKKLNEHMKRTMGE